MHHEAYISAQQDQAPADPRFPRPHAEQDRSRGHRAPPCQGAQEIVRLAFRPSNRLLRRPEFQSAFDRGRRYFTQHFVVFALARDASEPWRLGLTVTRKTGSAPLRNRVKRVLREFFRLYQRECDPPHDYVVVPKKHLDPRLVGLDMVREELLPVLGRIRRQAPAGGGAKGAKPIPATGQEAANAAVTPPRDGA